MGVKVAYGLIAVALVVVVGLWVSRAPTTIQVDPGPIAPPASAYDPVDSGEETPDGYYQLLPRDAIRPVYNPTFKTAPETEWPEEALVIGVEQDDEAKAYPVSFLTSREMVNDWIGNTPLLVTW